MQTVDLSTTHERYIDRLAALVAEVPWSLYDAGVPEALRARLPVGARVSRGGGVYRLAFALLALLGASGHSLRFDLLCGANRCFGLPDPLASTASGTYSRASRFLETTGLWRVHVAAFAYRHVTFVQLTPAGDELLAEEGLSVLDSDWDRVVASHRGAQDGGQQEHTAAICMFLHHARIRGYTALACPTGDFGRAEPDALIALNGQPYFVEVQGRGGSWPQLRQKWRNQLDLQGFVAVCARAPGQLARYINNAQTHAQAPLGLGTDLATLADQPNLWSHRWLTPYMPFEEIGATPGLTLPADRLAAWRPQA